MKNMILATALLVSGFYVYQRYFTPPTAKSIVFRDIEGYTHSFTPPCKPVVLAFWTSRPSATSDRALAVLDRIREKNAPAQLDVVAVYLDRAMESDIAYQAQKAGRRASVAVAQTSDDTGELDALRQVFKIREPGQDIYVVGADGVFHLVDAGDPNMTPDHLEAAVAAQIAASVKF
jgi:hypothetical protein